MSDTPLRLTLRQLQAAYRDPMALATMIGVGIIAGITGPFSTFAHLAPAPRLFYWLLIALGTYGAGLVGAILAREWLLPHGKPVMALILVQGVGASIPVTACVVLISLTFFPDLTVTGLSLGELFVYCLLISLALMAVLEGVIAPQLKKRPAIAAPPAVEAPPILDRLPKPVRGKLSHMSMADHYVEVFTDRGKAMILMRLADAIAETRGTEGIQIHRSHWVALDAIAALKRLDGRPVVALVDGTELPVSRTHINAVRAALERK
ncbi:LytTR family DNA-binding domain-containing protein [Pelagibacterium sp. H642]|uniref:LytTR family DNA-binding domain-containing protein n=1 Tax=Pelagibacterium sp. H642 TaxID=1881069 RepID=UPI002814CEAF|nr:LytTR family DNA-binding domain-containing protein [Pelagibacterium sp. H642]WMT92104.1 LytTR family transcriptional regulator [Pelagibacterium sp. H642]